MDRNFELSSYQKDIINFVRTQRGNLLVDAKAGSGKTSTLIMIADELTATGNKCLFLAFNKHIVEELQQKITNTNCMIKTVHSLGFTFIKSFLYRKHNTHYVLEVDTSKLRNLVKDYYDNNFRNRLDIYNATGVCDVEGYDSDELDELSDGAMKLDDKELKDLHNNIISDFVGLCNFSRLYNINYKAMGSLDGLVEKFCWHLDKFKREIFPDYQDLIIAVIDKTKELFENPDLAPNGDPVYVVDYTDMLYFPVLYNMQIPYSIKDYLNTVLVDECQDLSILQQKFIQKLQSNFNRFIFVGDKYQCQPAGTKILMSDKTYKNIEDVEVGDKVIQFIEGKASYFTSGNSNKEGIITEVQKTFSNELIEFTTASGKVTRYTPNHKCFARFNTRDGYVVYIMCDEEKRYRIGISRLFNSTNNMGFGMRLRMRQENCKYGWIVCYCKTRQEALFNETYISLKYRIPQLIFYEGDNHTKRLNSVDELYNLWSVDMNIAENVEKCLNDYNRDINYPLVKVGDYSNHISSNHKFLLEACNIIPEIMDFVVYTDAPDKYRYSHHIQTSHNKRELKADYDKIVTCKYINDFNNVVYCLKVDDQSNYVADNILTHNCIYAFAGADTHAIEKLDETFILQHLPLNICYRCPENVVRLAREIVPTIEWNASRTDKGEVKFLDMDDVVKFIQPNDVLIGRKNKDLLKLYRKFVLELKKPVKFRNRELVNNLIHSIEMVIMEYIKLYARGTNIFKPLTEHMANFIKDTGCTRDDDLYEKEYKDYSKKLIDANTGKSNRVSKSNNTIAYLVKCMKEYKEFGEYGLNDDDVLTEYYDVIMDFIEDFKKKSAKILIDDFKLYLQRFLSGSEYDRVPIISSVHSMKGGEADNVYIFDYPLFPYKMGGNMSEDDEQQERNLKYVAVTRAKKNLYLVRCEPTDERFIKANLESEATVDFLVNDCSIH